MTRTTRLRSRPPRQPCCRVAVPRQDRSPDSFSIEDDPDNADESEPPFAVNPVSAAPQIPDFLKHPKVADSSSSTTSAAPVAAGDGGADGTAAGVEGEQEDGLKLPPLEILHANPQSASSASSDKELEQTAESLQSTLLEFGRSARVVGWIAGPTVTTFKLQPGEGERVSKISSLEDDIALSLAAQSVRIFAPIPGQPRSWASRSPIASVRTSTWATCFPM